MLSVLHQQLHMPRSWVLFWVALSACAYQEPGLEPRFLTGSVQVNRASGVLANGHDSVAVRVSLSDDLGAPAADMPVRVRSSGVTDIVEQDGLHTDEDGSVTAVVRSTEEGRKTITATVTTTYGERTLDDRPEVVFVIGAEASLAFTPPLTLPTGGHPRDLTTVHLYGTDRPDIVVANWSAGNVAMFANTSQGFDSEPVLLPVPATPHAVAATDLHGNGTASLLVAHSNLDQLTVYDNPTALPGSPDHTFATGEAPRAMALLPPDAGSQYLAIVDSTSSTVSLMSLALPLQEPTFQEVGGIARGVRALRLSEQGWGFAIAYEHQAAIHVFATPPASWEAVRTLQLDARATDFRPIELAGQHAHALVVLMGPRFEVFTPNDSGFALLAASGHDLPASGTSFTTCDLQGNGHADLVILVASLNTAHTYLGQGDGTYVPSHVLSTGDTPAAVHCADLDRDGKDDIMIANSKDGTITVYYSLEPGL